MATESGTKRATPLELHYLRSWWLHQRPRLLGIMPQVFESADPENKLATWRGPLSPEASPTEQGLRLMLVAKAIVRFAWQLWHYVRNGGRFPSKDLDGKVPIEQPKDLWAEAVARWDVSHAGAVT
jgi:hypothetical protein